MPSVWLTSKTGTSLKPSLIIGLPFLSSNSFPSLSLALYEIGAQILRAFDPFKTDRSNSFFHLLKLAMSVAFLFCAKIN